MKEVVDKIRAAEKKAAELKAEAVSEAEYNLKKVREKGKKYVDDTVASASRSAALMIKQAEEETAEAAAEKIKEADERAGQIMMSAEHKIDEAADRIVERIMGSI